MLVNMLQATQKGPKACTTCAKAKARCIPGPTGVDKCERCERLKKECFSRPPAPPRVKKRPKRSRVAELEKRLNELSSQVGNVQPRMPTPEHGVKDSTASETSCNRGELLSMTHLFPSPHTPETNDDPVPSSSEWRSDKYGKLDSLWPMPDEATILLDEFHEMFEHLFPFIVVSKELKSEELRDRRPYLWKAIMMVAVLFDGARQVKLGEELLAEITRASLLEGVKTLDLLQSLQLLIGWFHYALKGTQLTHLLFLARSMCVNLSSIGCEPLPQEGKYSDLDHLRAYAGTYYLNTLVFTTNKKTDIFMNTSHLETCCKVLENVLECQSDLFLVKLVKIQQLAQSISVTMAFDPQQPALQLPLTMVAQSFQEQIDAYRSSLPDSLKDNCMLLAHISVAEILLKDISISDQHCGSPNMALTDRLQLLWACVRSLQGFFRVRSVGRDIERPRFVNLTASDIAYTIITGIKLLAVRLPGWDPAEISKELALSDMIDWLATDLGLVIERRKGGRVMSGQPIAIAEDPLERLWRLLKNARELVELQLRRTAQGLSTEGEMSPYLLGDLDESLWFDLVAEGGNWAMNDENGAAMPVM